jgi:TPP-dependent pyruvate/acetoin dehydrogenase alpha subunit
VSADLLPEFYRRMYAIRRFEETLLAMFTAGELVGTTHTCIGQEANAVGLIDHLEPARDVIFSNHRCHGHFLAFTGDQLGLLSEVMGREGGVCSGKGGSQHLCARNFYSNGVQGSILPVATGIALAEKHRGEGAVTTVFLGDGTLGQGTVYESLNMAALWQLPLLFVVEDNHYAQTTPSRLAVAGSIPARAEAFGIETAALDTTDVMEIHREGGRAVERVRASGAPFMLVLDTYRFSPHSKGDEIRDPAEIAARRERDPLTVAAEGMGEEQRGEIEAGCEAELERVVAAARKSPPAGAEGMVAR